jgi:hypothetical protein
LDRGLYAGSTDCVGLSPLPGVCAFRLERPHGVEVDAEDGCPTATDRVSGRVWEPDPRMKSAGSLIYRNDGQQGWWNLSSASDVKVARDAERTLTIRCHNRDGQGGRNWSM